MNYTIPKILTAIIAIAIVFVVPAQAEPKGKKLNFNGALGSFTAVPSRGSGSSKKSKSKKSYGKNPYGSSAARKRKAKAATIRKAKIRAARKKARLAAIRRAKKAAAAKRQARALAEKGRALAARDSNDSSDEEKSTKSVADDDGVEGDVEISEPIDVDTRVNASLDEPVDEAEESAQSDHRVTCKKFIPSAGLTITVPCTEQ